MYGIKKKKHYIYIRKDIYLYDSKKNIKKVES